MMNAFKVTEDSWHFNFLKWTKFSPWVNYGVSSDKWEVDRFYYRLPEDFCSYWRMFFGGVLKTLFFLFMGGFLLALTLTTIYMLVSVLVTETAAFFTGIAILLCIVGSVLGSSWLLNRLIEMDKAVKREDPKLGIVGMKYKAFKERFCPAVDYEVNPPK